MPKRLKNAHHAMPNIYEILPWVMLSLAQPILVNHVKALLAEFISQIAIVVTIALQFAE